MASTEKHPLMETAQGVDPELLKIMVCPLARTPLVQVGDWLVSTDAKTRRKYPIRDGIPIMLIDESVEMDVAEFERMMREAGAAA